MATASANQTSDLQEGVSVPFLHLIESFDVKKNVCNTTTTAV